MGKTSHRRTRSRTDSPALFGEDQLPERPELVKAVGRFEHNAKTTLRDEELCFAICEYLLLGHSQRESAAKFHVGRQTIQAIVRGLEASGKMLPLKKRLVDKFGQIAEAGADRILEQLDAGTFPSQVVGLMTCQITDKLLLLQGDPTVITEQRIVGPSFHDLNALVDALPIDVSSESVALPPLLAQKGVAEPLGEVPSEAASDETGPEPQQSR
jgi:hypothetical protein